ncbi:MAG: GNAT family N-acetyltransferase [Ginsengibacter sp.]
MESLEKSDLNSVTALQPEGWQDITPIICFYIKSSFCFPIKVTVEKKIAGIGIAIIHNDVAWLAHIIVHPDNRNKGIGKLITQFLVDEARAKDCDTIYLIATDLGEPVYKNLGFETETEYLFFKDIRPNESWRMSENIVAFADDFKTQVAGLDKQVSGEERLLHLAQYLEGAFVYLQNNVVEGFYLPAFGEGLIVANTTTAGIELMKLRLATKDNAAFPADNVSATAFMHQNNFKEFRRAKRMKLGIKREWQPESFYNRIGGNLG